MARRVAALALAGTWTWPLLAQPASPILGISVRGVSDGVVENGEPLRIAVQLRAGDRQAEQVVVSPATGTWADAITVELFDAQGRATGVRARSIGVPDRPGATVGGTLAAGGLWRLEPEATRTLAPGPYLLRATLTVAAAAPGTGGWTGEASSQSVELRLVAPSEDPERRGQRALALAHDALLDDRPQEAAAIVDELLADQPDNLRAWLVRAAVSERAGNVAGALLAVGRAQTIYRESKPAEPHAELEAIQSRLILALETGDPRTIAAASDARWTWPPRDLLPRSGMEGMPVSGSAVTAAQMAEQPAPPAADPPSAAAAIAVGAPEPPAPRAGAPAVSKPTVVGLGEPSEREILEDPRGQWATRATASSEYGRERYNAAQATGPPNVPGYSDHPSAWCPSGAAGGPEWLEVGFGRAVRATEVRVRQTLTPGSLVKVELVDPDGGSRVLWEGTDPHLYPGNEVAWFVLRFPPPPAPVDRVRLSFDIGRRPGWKQIDAVQLVGD